MKPIRAIPTEYRGHTFRSRLEARWAATFDELGWYWEYEPYAVDLGNGIRYLCDFYLPEQRTWVEIKGPVNARRDKPNYLRKALPARDLIIIARPAGPDEAVNFQGLHGYIGVSIQRCTSCPDLCFYDYWYDRNNEGDGWECRRCHTPDALQRTDGYLPAVERERILRGDGGTVQAGSTGSPKMGRQIIDAFWPTTGGILKFAQVPG